MISHDDYFRFAKQRETMQKNVQDLLRRFPQCREDYKILLFYYWHYIDGMISVLPAQLTDKLSSPESITRTFRQVTFEHPELAPTPRTEREREKQLDRMSRYYREKAREEHLRGRTPPSA